jgi:hypothetical protein
MNNISKMSVHSNRRTLNKSVIFSLLIALAAIISPVFANAQNTTWTAPTHDQAAICNCLYEIVSGPNNEDVLMVYDYSAWDNGEGGGLTRWEGGEDFLGEMGYAWRSSIDVIVFATETTLTDGQKEAVPDAVCSFRTPPLGHSLDIDGEWTPAPLYYYFDVTTFNQDIADGTLEGSHLANCQQP